MTPGLLYQKVKDIFRVKITDGTNTVAVNDSGQMKVVLDGKVDDGNSSIVTLGIGAQFTGVGSETLDYGIIFTNVYSDQASATNGLSIELSPDNVNWDSVDAYTISAATGKTYSTQPSAKYYRICYTNGAVAQTEFRLQTIYKKTNSLDSSHKIDEMISGEDDARLVKSILSAKNQDNNFINIEATQSNNLRTSNAEDGLAIAKGEVVGTDFIHKFGSAPDFDTGDNSVTIWDGSDDGNINQMIYQYSTTNDIDSLSSSDNLDTFDIEVDGLDVNYDRIMQTITLTGQTRAPLTTSLIRVFRITNVSNTVNVGHIYCYKNVALVGGIPTVSTDVRGVMQPLLGQTLMSLITVPNGYTAYMRDWYASTAGAKKSTSYTIDLFARPFNEVFQLKHRSAIDGTGTSYIQHIYMEPEVFMAKTDIEMRTRITAASVTEASVSGGFDIVFVED